MLKIFIFNEIENFMVYQTHPKIVLNCYKKKLKDKEKSNKTKTSNVSRSDQAKDLPAGNVLGIY